VVGPLVRAWKEIDDPTSYCNKTVTTINGKTASPGYVRHRLSETDTAELIDAYRSGITAKVLAERYNVHYTTIKKKLRKYGVRRGGDMRSTRSDPRLT
jgi:transcriptional regulator of aromatic amino acid metabolism